jgi:hypothetical protein
MKGKDQEIKEMHNQLEDMRGNIRVFSRLKPLDCEDASSFEESIFRVHKRSNKKFGLS